jgi:5S rRNA maturation endonuclease (ribonuclease M5)
MTGNHGAASAANGDARLDAKGIAHALGRAVEGTDGWWNAKCPAHDDSRPSLTLRDTDDGGVAWKCMAGCESRAVAAALKARGLLPERPRRKGKGRGRIVDTYEYHDEKGVLLFQVVRFEPKSFSQRRPDPNRPGEWIWSLGKIRRVLFGLPELLAADPAETVWICEGEKDVDRLRALGLVATTSPQGADKWHLVDDAPLAGRHVVILPDLDEPGRKHAQRVAQSLVGKAASTRILELPITDPGKDRKDVSDWLDRCGGTVEELRRLAAEAPPYVPKEADQTPEDDADTQDKRVRIQLAEEHVNDNARVCARLLDDEVFMRGPEPMVLVRVEEVGGAREVDDKEPEPGVVIGGVRHARGSPILTEPTPERI